MSVALMRLIKRCNEFRPFGPDELDKIPPDTRGIYVLFDGDSKQREHGVMYVGLSGADEAGIRGRLRKHLANASKGSCTCFSVFEVHDNVSEQEIQELEGILRHIFRRDPHANRLAKQVGYEKLRKVREKDWAKWKVTS